MLHEKGFTAEYSCPAAHFFPLIHREKGSSSVRLAELSIPPHLLTSFQCLHSHTQRGVGKVSAH